MPETQIIAINTSPLLALIAAWGDLSRLKPLYQDVLVSLEVSREILQGGSSNFGVSEFQSADCLTTLSQPRQISPYLRNSLDLGEASVIQLALDRSINAVCLDEVVGRRVARLNGLKVNGSVRILLKAKQQDPTLSIKHAIANMLQRNIRLSQTVIDFALKQAGEV